MEGYPNALLKVFEKKFGILKTPSGVALCKFRQRISYKFFEEIFKKLIANFDQYRPTFRGLKIYAIDGKEFLIPRSEDILNEGYSGRAVSKYYDTHYAKMYVVHAYDVLSKTSKDLYEYSHLDEITGAVEMVKNFESDSLTIYDALYPATRIFKAHHQTKSYFLIRARKKGILKPIQEFYSSKKKQGVAEIEGERVHMIKFKLPGSKKKDVFISNLPFNWITKETILKLYALRWECETSFRDLVYSTFKAEQWHSKFMNGIRQELFVKFWLYNFTRILVSLRTEKGPKSIGYEYKKTNYKQVHLWILKKLDKILESKRGVLKEFNLLVNKLTRKRKRFSRKYPREIKYPGSSFIRNSTVLNRGMLQGDYTPILGP